MDSKKIKISFTQFILLSLGLISVCNGQPLPYKNKNLPVETRVADLLGRMTLEEKILQMSNTYYPDDVSADHPEKIPAGYGTMNGNWENNTFAELAARQQMIQEHQLKNTRLGIPTMFTAIGTHGLFSVGTTIFPQMISLGSTWNRKLVEDVASAIAREHAVVGLTQEFGPSLDCAVDPRWGRTEECFGQDPFHVAEIGIAYVRGRQGDLRNGAMLAEDKIHNIIKHFTGYSKPNGGINLAPASISERELRSVFAYPFRKVIRELNPLSVMPSYNSVNSIPVHADPKLLKDLLRDELGFKGYVYSDWGAVEMLYNQHKVAATMKDAALLAVNSGIDLNGPGMGAFEHLKESVEKGEIELVKIDNAVANVLRVKFLTGLFDGKRQLDVEKMNRTVHSPEHIRLALESAEESCVLLENNKNILPLKADAYRNIALIGPSADQVQFGGSSFSHDNKYGTTVRQGISRHLPANTKLRYARGCGITNLSTEGFQEAIEAARKSDLIIFAGGGTSTMFGGVGLNINERVAASDAGTSGEGLDRAVLHLPGVQEELLRELHKLGKPIILILLNGRPQTIPWLKQNMNAILEAWYPGEEGGTAIGNILFGKVNPSGRLAMDWPQTTGHIYTNYAYLPISRGFYKKPGSFEKPGNDYVEHSPDALYPFGYGLSYTTFEYDNLVIADSLIGQNDVVKASVRVKNMGTLRGKEVVQLYIHDELASVAVPVKQLKGFEKIDLLPGESKVVHFEVPASELSLWNKEMKEVVEPGWFTLMVGRSSEDIKLSGRFLFR